jgi:hypothetical protein
MTMNNSAPDESRTQSYVVVLMAIIILGFCAYGFGTKFYELVMLAKDTEATASEGSFAVMPIVNYLLASAGFLCLLGWAAYHGMFHDIERPKRTMLEMDEQLDAKSTDLHFSDSVLK